MLSSSPYTSFEVNSTENNSIEQIILFYLLIKIFLIKNFDFFLKTFSFKSIV